MRIARLVVFLLIIAAFVIALVYSFAPENVPFLKASTKVTLAQSSPLLPYPVKVENYQNAPQLTAQATTVIENETGVVLLQKQPDLRRLPASTTKLMTALVALENCLPQAGLKVGFVQEEGSKMGIQVGDVLTVESLLHGLLVNSGNDAAYTLANSCADSYQGFIAAMNKKAKDLGMKNTHFQNPAGFDDKYQYSTASDLTKLSRAAVANPLIAKIVKTKSAVVNDVTGTKTYYLENVNELLGVVPGLEGVKTGQTEGSLENLVTYTKRNGHGVITVVLGSQDRFGESQNLIEWAFANHKWLNP